MIEPSNRARHYNLNDQDRSSSNAFASFRWSCRPTKARHARPAVYKAVSAITLTALSASSVRLTRFGTTG